jgi:hypothetical protein
MQHKTFRNRSSAKRRTHSAITMLHRQRAPHSAQRGTRKDIYQCVQNATRNVARRPTALQRTAEYTVRQDQSKRESPLALVPACSARAPASSTFHTYGTPVGLSAGTRGLTDSGGFSAERCSAWQSDGELYTSLAEVGAAARLVTKQSIRERHALWHEYPEYQRLPCCGYPSNADTRGTATSAVRSTLDTAGTRASSATTRTPACRGCCSRSSAGTSSRRRTGTIV